MRKLMLSIVRLPITVACDLLAVSGWLILGFGVVLLYAAVRLRRLSPVRDFN